MPCFIGTYERPALSWMEMEDEGLGCEWERDWEGKMGGEAVPNW